MAVGDGSEMAEAVLLFLLSTATVAVLVAMPMASLPLTKETESDTAIILPDSVVLASADPLALAWTQLVYSPSS